RRRPQPRRPSSRSVSGTRSADTARRTRKSPRALRAAAHILGTACPNDPRGSLDSSRRNTHCSARPGQPACGALSTPSASSSAARFASLPPSFPPAPARDRRASELFFKLQVLRRDLRHHGAQPIDLSLLPRLDSALARCPLAFTLQRACGPVIRNSAPSIKHRWRQAVSATDLADRYPRLLRFPQNRQLLFRCKSPILTHGPRASCGLPAAARSFPFFGFVFVPKSLKLHTFRISHPPQSISSTIGYSITSRRYSTSNERYQSALRE